MDQPKILRSQPASQPDNNFSSQAVEFAVNHAGYRPAVHGISVRGSSHARRPVQVARRPLEGPAAQRRDRRNKLLLVAPWMKFVMGGGCYIASVIALSFEALQYIPVFRYLCLGIGLMSMSVVLLTFMRVHS